MLVRRICLTLLGVAIAVYAALLLHGWWGQEKGAYPRGSGPSGPQRPALCSSEEVAPFVVVRASKDFRRDARPLLLEFHQSDIFYSDLLTARPDCIAGMLAYYQRNERQIVILLIDRHTGQATARLSLLGDSLTR